MSALFTCSIDDGHPSDMKMAELLEKYGLRGTFYLPIRNREGLPVMADAQIRELGRRFEIGSHTYDHCYLKSVGINEARSQITEGKKRLEDLLGQDVAGFCYPGGKYRKEHVDMVRSAGFSYARTTLNLCFDAGDSLFEVPTTSQFYPHHRSVYLRNFAKYGNWGKRRRGLEIALRHHDWIERTYALFDYACAQDRVFHLWAHSHDVDDLKAWCEVDRFFAYVASKVTPQNRLSNRQLVSRNFFVERPVPLVSA